MNWRPGVAHRAIGSRSLEVSYAFYINGLGCKIAPGLERSDRLRINFFNTTQLVVHLSDEQRPRPASPYPDHWGHDFSNPDEFDLLLGLVKQHHLDVYLQPQLRFPGEVDEHRTLMLCDPFNYLIEFKSYPNPERMFG